ncbi:axonemal dynein light chain domain-containing protein 1 isoform X2 [Nothobranchius furzeri]|uniref:Transcript variant X2 n=3 Tax=Nothobranchius TaxID=28779 RepID=A0A9D3BAF4_NOTFU|nr:transcript variant X2 [Nothobranchius furzeri]
MSESTRARLASSSRRPERPPDSSRDGKLFTSIRCLVHVKHGGAASLTDLKIQAQPGRENNQLLPARPQRIPHELMVNLTSSICNRSTKSLIAHHRHCKNFEIRRPDPIWYHPLGRKKYRYFLEQPTSLTGAGRDISFLCDAVDAQRTARPLPSLSVKNPLDMQNTCVSEHVIPEEYHIVKKKGLSCLELYDDAFTVQLKDQERRLRVLPSLRPSGRLEAVQLMTVMDDMLEKAGVHQQNEELTQPCQLEGLLELVKVEQNIYNVVFHELIRQVTVECAERGQVLAKLRQRYQSLLDRIPCRLKALHTETVAQRALNRRLMEEVCRIQASMQHLHMELSKTRDHNSHVSQQVEHAHHKLSEDIMQTHYSEFVQGYHELYERERARLEAQLLRMAEERDCWKHFTLRIALKVISVKKLHLVRQLHVSENYWFKSAEHCLLYFSSKDTDDLNVIIELTSYWKEQLMALVSELEETEHAQCTQITDIQQGISKWLSFISMQNQCPDPKYEKTSVKEIHADLKQWSETLLQWEEHRGEKHLLCQQKLSELSQVLEKWLCKSHTLYERHPSPHSGALQGQKALNDLDRVVTKLLKLLQVQVSDKSGIFRLIKSLVELLDLWVMKTSDVTGQLEMMPLSDWLKLEEALFKGQSLAEEALLIFPSGQRESRKDENKLDLQKHTNKVLEDIQETTSSLSIFTEHQNQKLREDVNSVHMALVQWMLDLVLVMVPDQGEEQNHELEPDGVSLRTLNEVANMLSEKLVSLSSQITRSCNLVLEEQMLLQHDASVFENEMNACKKLQRESFNWVETCKILVTEVSGDALERHQKQPAPLGPPITADPGVTVETQDNKESSVKIIPNDVEDVREEMGSDPVELEHKDSERPVLKMIDFDGNITDKDLEESRVHLPGTDELVVSPVTEESQRAFNELTVMVILQQQLMDAEVRAANAEQRAQRAEEALQASLEKQQLLESQLQTPPEPQNTNETTPPTTPAPPKTTPPEAKPSTKKSKKK